MLRFPHTRETKFRVKRVSLTLLQLSCTRRCCPGIGRSMWTRYFVCSRVTTVISILIKSRAAVLNTECRSRYEKLYFPFEQFLRYKTLYIWKWYFKISLPNWFLIEATCPKLNACMNVEKCVLEYWGWFSHQKFNLILIYHMRYFVCV